eukprot:scaffold1507_cov158-Ochromonas_danica.AAC.19
MSFAIFWMAINQINQQRNTHHDGFHTAAGNRATVSARIGQSLLDACFLHKVDIEGPCGGGGSAVEVHRTPIWTESTFGEGPTCFLCHVQIPSKYNHLLPPMGDHEVAGLEEAWEEEKVKSSRLACQITLDRKHDGMVVYIPDSSPADLV